MDLITPQMDCIEATREVTARQPGARVLVVTSFVADDKVFPAIKAGALGYILKDTSPDDLVRAIRQVYRGEPTLEPEIARRVLFELAQPPKRPLTPDRLTGRELDVLRLLAQGMSNREIAEDLVLAEMTVRTHISSILGKLHLASRTQAALYALKEGLASLDDMQQHSLLPIAKSMISGRAAAVYERIHPENDLLTSLRNGSIVLIDVSACDSLSPFRGDAEPG